MKKSFLLSTLATAIALGGLAAPAEAQTEPETEVAVGGRLQMMGLAEWLESEPHRSQGRIYLFMKQSRLDFTARRGDTRFYSQLALGGEDVFTNNVNLTLLDMYAEGPLLGLANWRIGQFRVPYGRELITDAGKMAFWDRSITSPFFLMGRDVGAALSGTVGPATVVGGVFLGGGRDVPQRYLPEVLGIPLLAMRASVGDLDESPYELSQHDALETSETRQALSWSGLFTRDSLVGHSTVLNVKNSFEKSLLLSSAWNPYIGKRDPGLGHAPQGQLFQTALDYAVKTPFAGGTLAGEAEVNYGNFGNSFGSLGVVGARAQAGYYQAPFEAMLRYAVVFPDANFATTNTTAGSPTVGQTTPILPGGTPIQEITPALTYFLQGDQLKLVVDFPILVNAPVVTEQGFGNYNLVNQPDQAALLNNPANAISRQLVFQMRAGLQYAF